MNPNGTFQLKMELQKTKIYKNDPKWNFASKSGAFESIKKRNEPKWNFATKSGTFESIE